MMAKAQPSAPPTDWLAIGRSLALLLIGFMSVWTTIEQRSQAAKTDDLAAKVAPIAATVEKIRHQTDGNATAAKLAIAISASSLAKATNDEKDLKTATEAWAAYEAQMKIQQSAEPP